MRLCLLTDSTLRELVLVELAATCDKLWFTKSLGAWFLAQQLKALAVRGTSVSTRAQVCLPAGSSGGFFSSSTKSLKINDSRPYFTFI